MKVGGGGGNISDYVVLVVPYSSSGGEEACPPPPPPQGNFCALKQLLVHYDYLLALSTRRLFYLEVGILQVAKNKQDQAFKH